jgi:4'-phosphopantetheinyl transferase
MSSTYNPNGSWTHEFRSFVEGLRASDDRDYVLSHVRHPETAVRKAVAEWFSFGDAHWTRLGIDPATVPPEFGHGPMPADVATVLVADPDWIVAVTAVLRVTDPTMLVDVVLDPGTHPSVVGRGTERILTLGALDELLERLQRAGEPLPVEAARVLARRCDRTDVLESLLPHDELRDSLLANGALTDAQLRHLIGHIAPGRPGGTPAELAAILDQSSLWFTRNADIGNPGGFEAAELRECGPAAGRLFGTIAPLCRAAADVVSGAESDAPAWVSEAVTWALELTRVTTDWPSICPRLGISPKVVTPERIPDVDVTRIRSGATDARRAGEADPRWRELAEGAATALDGLAVGGSLPWLRKYGGGNGYDHHHVFEILALRSAAPLLDRLAQTPGETAPRTRLVVAYGAVPAPELLRAEAARFHEVPASEVVLVHECPRCGSSAHGRPQLVATASVRHPAYVSLARAGDLSVVAVTDAGPVGVDVEAEGAADFAGFPDVALHPGERETSADDPTRVWVRKEALLKAYGLGLAVDPSDVRLDDDGLASWDSPHRPPGVVWLRDLAVPGHVVAVAVLAEHDIEGLSVATRPASA